VRRDDEDRPLARSRPHCDDVAFLVDARVPEAERGEAPCVVLRAHLLLERRRGDDDDLLLLGERLRVIGPDEVQRFLYLRVRGDRREAGAGVVGDVELGRCGVEACEHRERGERGAKYSSFHGCTPCFKTTPIPTFP
jgi:hypothetical protein